MVWILFRCGWCGELLEEEYMCFWRKVNGKKVDEVFLHFGCETDFKRDSGKKHWYAKGFEADPEIHIDPVIARWRAKKDAEENSDDDLR